MARNRNPITNYLKCKPIALDVGAHLCPVCGRLNWTCKENHQERALKLLVDFAITDEKHRAYAMEVEEWKALSILVGYIPPEPDTLTQVIGAPEDWPWTDEDMRDEIMNRYPDGY